MKACLISLSNDVIEYGAFLSWEIYESGFASGRSGYRNIPDVNQ